MYILRSSNYFIFRECIGPSLHIIIQILLGFVVIEHAYKLGSSDQKHALLAELYSTELQLFKDLVSIKERR